MKRIIIGCILVLIIAPILGGVTYKLLHSDTDNTPQENVSTATKEDIKNAINTRNDSLPESEKYSTDFEVTKYKQVTKWWYIATIDIGGVPQSVILSRFTSDSVRAVTSPGTGVPYYNISGGLGVPYEVIDEYNKNWSADYE